jgi:hypothetical protein
MSASRADECQNNNPVYRCPDVARALDRIKRAARSADSAYGRFLAVRDGRAELERIGDDYSDAIGDLSDFAVSRGLHPDDVQKALALGLDLFLEERGVSGGLGQKTPTSTFSRPYEVSAVSAVAADDTSDEWTEPDLGILNGRQASPPEFPEISPRVIQAWLASFLIGIARCIHPVKAWPEPCTMWMGIVGFSGDRQDAGLDVIKRALDKVEKNRKYRIDGLRLTHETRVEVAKAASKKWKDEVEEAIQEGQTPPTKPATAVDPGPFVVPHLHVSNTTIEQLATLLTANPRGQLVIADELSGLFLNMSRHTNGQDNEFWLEAWNGKSFNVERQTRSISIDNLLVGLLGGFQPDKLEPSFGDRHLAVIAPNQR